MSVCHEGICLTACLGHFHVCNSSSLGVVTFFSFKSRAYLNKNFFISLILCLFFFFFYSSYSSEKSFQDVALISRGLKLLRVTVLITCQILGERCLAGCNVSLPSVPFCLLHSAPPRLSLSIFISLDLLYICYLWLTPFSHSFSFSSLCSSSKHLLVSLLWHCCLYSYPLSSHLS